MTFVTSRRSRTVPLVGALLTTALVLSGCGTDDADQRAGGDGTAGGATDHLPAAEGTTEYPLTLETAWGETVPRGAP